jgi:hypothetical protein
MNANGVWGIKGMMTGVQLLAPRAGMLSVLSATVALGCFLGSVQESGKGLVLRGF